MQTTGNPSSSLEGYNTFTDKKMQTLRGAKEKEIQTTAGSQPRMWEYAHIDSTGVFSDFLSSVTPVCARSLQLIQSFATPWVVAHQAPLSRGFSRQEYWNGLPCPPPGDLPGPGIKPESLNVSCIGRWVLYY